MFVFTPKNTFAEPLCVNQYTLCKQTMKIEKLIDFSIFSLLI